MRITHEKLTDAENNKYDLLELFNKNPGKAFTGKELIDAFNNVSSDVIKNNTYALVKEDIITDVTKGTNKRFNNKIFYKLSEKEEQDIQDLVDWCFDDN